MDSLPPEADFLPEDILSAEVRELLERESGLEEEMRSMEERLSGLRDIDLVLSLAEVKLRLCIRLMRLLAARGAAADTEDDLGARIAERAFTALRLVESLTAENVSEDQRGVIRANPLYPGVRARMEEFILAGGGGFLEAEQTDARSRRILSRTIVAAILRYAGPDDRIPPLELEKLPRFVRRILLALFPVMIREHPAQPPYGIEEGAEVVYSSSRMKLPLSQAIFYMDNELIPELEKRLEDDPGSHSLQEEIRRARQRVEDYRKLKFFPRSTPVLLEHGYYTDGMTGYTTDGEMLVAIPLPVSFRSGTNSDRIMELVRMDVVRRLAGRGVSPAIDREYRRLRSLESGMRGSSRTASMKLDTVWGYGVLRQGFPFLTRLSDKKRFAELVRTIRTGIGTAERRIEVLIQRDQSSALPRARAIGRDAEDPGGAAL